MNDANAGKQDVERAPLPSGEQRAIQPEARFDLRATLYGTLTIIGFVATLFQLAQIYLIDLLIIVPMTLLFLGGLAGRWRTVPGMLLILIGLTFGVYAGYQLPSATPLIFTGLGVAFSLYTASFYRFLAVTERNDRQMIRNPQSSIAPDWMLTDRQDEDQADQLATVTDLAKLLALLALCPVVASYGVWPLLLMIAATMNGLQLEQRLQLFIGTLFLLVFVVIAIRTVLFAWQRWLLSAEEARVEMHDYFWNETAADTEVLHRYLFRRSKPYRPADRPSREEPADRSR